jgi:hypothetical protein
MDSDDESTLLDDLGASQHDAMALGLIVCEGDFLRVIVASR